VVKFTLRPYLPREIISVPAEYVAVWILVPVCTLRRTGKGEILPLPGFETRNFLVN